MRLRRSHKATRISLSRTRLREENSPTLYVDRIVPTLRKQVIEFDCGSQDGEREDNRALDRKLTVVAHAFSNSAREAIEARGGTVTVIGEPRKIGPRRLAAKTAKRTPKGEEGEASPTSPRSGEVGPTAKQSGRVGVSEQPEAEESTPTKES